MEAVGLVLGIAGLAGLFSSCIGAFTFIEGCRSRLVDLQILLTKLDVEKARLLQWDEAAGLLGEDRYRDPRLRDPDHRTRDWRGA